MRRLNTLNYFWIAVCCVSSWAAAERADRSQPISIEANHAEVSAEGGQMSYHGNVILSQGTLQLRANSVNARQLPDKRQLLNAQGSPAVFKQRLDPTGNAPAEWIEGQAHTLEYDSQNMQIKLTGNAKIKRGQDIAQGHTIIYEGSTGQFRVDHGGKGRIQIILQPRP